MLCFFSLVVILRSFYGRFTVILWLVFGQFGLNLFYLFILVFFSKFEIFKDFLDDKISNCCVWHCYVTSILQALDFCLTREFCVWAFLEKKPKMSKLNRLSPKWPQNDRKMTQNEQKHWFYLGFFLQNIGL